MGQVQYCGTYHKSSYESANLSFGIQQSSTIAGGEIKLGHPESEEVRKAIPLHRLNRG